MQTGVNTFGARFFETQDRLIAEDREWRAARAAADAIPVPRAVPDREPGETPD